jgi:methylthioribose-1-phosphate isomerase
MTAIILPFPSSAAFAIRVVRALDDEGCWLVLTHCRAGWLHADFGAALHDAGIIAAGFGVAVRSSAGGSAS